MVAAPDLCLPGMEVKMVTVVVEADGRKAGRTVQFDVDGDKEELQLSSGFQIWLLCTSSAT